MAVLESHAVRKNRCFDVNFNWIGLGHQKSKDAFPHFASFQISNFFAAVELRPVGEYGRAINLRLLILLYLFQVILQSLKPRTEIFHQLQMSDSFPRIPIPFIPEGTQICSIDKFIEAIFIDDPSEDKLDLSIDGCLYIFMFFYDL